MIYHTCYLTEFENFVIFSFLLISSECFFITTLIIDVQKKNNASFEKRIYAELYKYAYRLLKENIYFFRNTMHVIIIRIKSDGYFILPMSITVFLVYSWQFTCIIIFDINPLTGKMIFRYDVSLPSLSFSHYRYPTVSEWS